MRMQSLAIVGLALLLAGCPDNSPSPRPQPPTTVVTVTPPPPPPPPPPTSSADCSLSARQAWVRQLVDEWYLFPNLVDTTVRPTDHTTVESYLAALIRPATEAGRDRRFTGLTSLSASEAFFNRGETVGFGFRIDFVRNTSGDLEVYLADVYESSVAHTAGLRRGHQILALGTQANNLRTISDLIDSGGVDAVYDLFGDNEVGVTRHFRYRSESADVATTSLTKSEYTIDPISDDFGTRIIEDGDNRYGYINLRTFTSPADEQFETIFSDFRTQNIDHVIIDFRSNGGGRVRTAEILLKLLGRNRQPSDIMYTLQVRPSQSANNEITRFGDPAFDDYAEASIAPMRLAFLTTRNSASASELVPNALVPYLEENLALVGTDTSGKDVGQFGFTRRECDDQLFLVTFSTPNSEGNGDYPRGLASARESDGSPLIKRTLAADDDIRIPFGDSRDELVSRAMDFLAGRCDAPVTASHPCTPISGAAHAANAPTGRVASVHGGAADSPPTPQFAPIDIPRLPRNPSPAQREIPGLF